MQVHSSEERRYSYDEQLDIVFLVPYYETHLFGSILRRIFLFHL